MIIVMLFLIASSRPGLEQGQTRSEEAYAERSRELMEQIAKEGISQEDLDSSASVMRELAENEISEDEARSRLIRIADGKLVKFVANRVFRNFFRMADPKVLITVLKQRGFSTTRLEELQTEVNFCFRPQTETATATWDLFTNTLFIPVEFHQPGTGLIRPDLRPDQINTLLHELDHADKDLRNDLLRMRGKSLAGKLHAGIFWGTIFCFVGLLSATLLGTVHRFRPKNERLRRLRFLSSPQVALGVIAGSIATGILIALVYQALVPARLSDLHRIEQQNHELVSRLRQVIHSDGATQAGAQTGHKNNRLLRLIREAMRYAVLGGVGGAILGLALGLSGLGPKLMGELRILKALGYPRAMVVSCGLIGALTFGCIGAWQTNRFGAFKAWEISAYYVGHCAQKVLEGQNDIASYNTKFLGDLSVSDLEQLRALDDRGQFKLLLPRRMYRRAAGSHPITDSPLEQLAADFPGDFVRLDAVDRGFEAYLAGSTIDFPYDDHPDLFRGLFETSLGLNLARMTLNRRRDEYSYRGLADFMERSELEYFASIRRDVRAARAERYRELMSEQSLGSRESTNARQLAAIGSVDAIRQPPVLPRRSRGRQTVEQTYIESLPTSAADEGTSVCWLPHTRRLRPANYGSPQSGVLAATWRPWASLHAGTTKTRLRPAPRVLSAVYRCRLSLRKSRARRQNMPYVSA